MILPHILQKLHATFTSDFDTIVASTRYNDSMIETPERVQELPVLVIKNIITLATSGFGLVVALAWNQAIQTLVQTYVTPYLGKDGGLASLFIYATIVTVLAVIVSMQLATIQRQIERFHEPRQKTQKKKK